MKKTILLSVFAIMMALFGTAQTAPTLFFPGIDTVNNVTATSIAASATRQGGGAGAWHAKLQVKASGTSVWLNSDTAHYATVENLTTNLKDSLVAATWYSVRFITYNFDYSDSAISFVRMAQTKPLPQPVTIGTVTTLSILPKPGLRFPATSISQNAFAFAAINMFPYTTVTDTLHFSGSIIDTIFFQNILPGQLTPEVTVIVIGADGSSAFSNPIPGFYAPGNTGGTLSLDTITKTPNSALVNIKVNSIGNVGGGSVLITKVTNSFDTVVLNTTQPVTIPITVGVLIPNLLSNTTHTGTSILVNGLGLADTLNFSFKTPNVPAPAINAVADAVDQFLSYGFSVPVNAASSYDSGRVVKIRVYEGINSNLIDSANTSITDTATIHFNETNKLPGTSYLVKVQAENAAHLLSNMVTLTVHTKSYTTNPAPWVDDLLTEGSDGLNITGLQFYIGLGNTATYALVVRDITDNILLDTIFIAYGATQDMAVASYMLTNLIGNHAISVTPITIGLTGTVAGNTLVQILPSPGSYPIATAIVKDNATSSSTMLSVTLFGSGEGNACTVDVHLEKDNVQVGSTQQAPGYFSGDIEYVVSWNSLIPGTQYKVVFNVIAPNGHSDTKSDFFWTDGATGIEEVETTPEVVFPTTIAENQHVRIINTIGQIIADGEYKNIRQDANVKGLVLLQLMDENGQVIPQLDAKGKTVLALQKVFQ